MSDEHIGAGGASDDLAECRRGGDPRKAAEPA